MVKICSFVAPTLTEGQAFRNSFVYNQEDDTVYYISDDGTPTRFGSSPMFIDNFQPDARPIPRQVVFDFANNKAYVYDPEGHYITIDLAGGSANKLHLTYVRGEATDWSRYIDEDVSTLVRIGNTESSISLRTFGSQAATFKDDNNQLYTLAQVFNLLKNGVEITFDNVPFGEAHANALSSVEFAYPIINGAKLTSSSHYDNTMIEEEEAFEFDRYMGIEPIFIEGVSSGAPSFNRVFLVPHSWGIVKHNYDGDVNYTLVVQADFERGLA